MFQESLDSSSVSSISTSRGSSGSLSNKNGPSPSSGKGSSKLFGQQSTSKAPAQPQAQKSKGKGQLSSKRPQKEQRPKASIETWLNKHAAANSAGADRDGASSCRSPVSTGARRRSKPRSRPTSASISFEISEDEDFQSTKLHVSMRQTTIAAQKLGKRQQEFLDELDDELNEAKALSLSLKRGPEPLRRGKPPAKRKRASSEAAALLERSDILSCTEAQSYIRQRAMALERMDETNQTCEGCTGDMMHYSSHPEEKQPTTEGVYLWNASATGTPASDYCPIFEMYKVGKG
ncbi:hypothetical protein GQ54DRAFT_295516 [Martensiomyces pterosporus]|nr:hypothetical protein GQ54DRAFT_295516 [Martensiomyces pterosporus]